MEKITQMKEDQVINIVIQELWEIYDDDKSGELDVDETRKFVKESLAALCQDHCFNE